jgi:putative sigma-54 modulation protein
MQTSVTFKNLDSSENLKSYVQNKLDRFDKFLDNPAIATVVLTVEKFRHIAEININGDRLSIQGKEETQDMYSAIDMVLDKLEKQIKKNKQKIKQHKGASKGKSKHIIDNETIHDDDKVARLVNIKNIDYKPMDVEEAMLQMDLVNSSFFVFTNSKTEKVNVLYRRNDGDYSLIQPSN